MLSAGCDDSHWCWLSLCGFSFLLLMWAESFVELDEDRGSEKYLPSFLLPCATGWHVGQFIHSFRSGLLCLCISVAIPPVADISLPGKSKGHSWPYRWPVMCPLWSSLSTSVNGDNCSCLLGELEGFASFIQHLSDMFCLRPVVRNIIFHYDVALNFHFLGQTIPLLWASVSISKRERITVPPS